VGADAEDVAAEAWSQIARDHRSFRGDYDKFRGWASAIARNRAIDFLRHRGRRPEVPAPVEEMVELAGHDREAQEALDRIVTGGAIEMITALPRPMAEAVLLRVVMGMDAKQAGRVLGKSAGAVRTAAYRGLRELAERLKAESDAAETGRPPAKETR
jgi:RNA polymerase sigma-70 factor (ECF subfamily)